MGGYNNWANSRSSGRGFCQIVGSLSASTCVVSIVGKCVCNILWGVVSVYTLQSGRTPYPINDCRPSCHTHLYGG